MSVATIDLKIQTAYKESEALARKELNWQEKIDNLLDRMNELSGFMDGMKNVVLRLTFEIERDMEGFRKSKQAPVLMKKLVKLSVGMLNVIRKSDLYPGVKTSYANLKQEISYLNELLHDREVSLALEEDDEMKNIIQSTLTAAKPE